MHPNNKNALPPQGQILQAYSPQVQLLQPIRIIATPPMTPFDSDSRSVVDNFSEASYEYYRNNYVFNQLPRQEYSTFGLPPMPPTPPDSPELAPRGKPRRHSKYSEAVVNGPPPPEPKKEAPEIAVIKLPAPAVKIQEEKPMPKPVDVEKPKSVEKPSKYTIEINKPGVQCVGNFKPSVPLKLTEREFGIIEDNRICEEKRKELMEKPPLTEKVVFPEMDEKKETVVVNKYVPKILKKDAEDVAPEQEPEPKPAPSKYVPKSIIEQDFKAVTAAVVEQAKPTGETPHLHLPYIQGLASQVKPYNTIQETRTEMLEFVTMEQVINIGSVLYYIPSQYIKMNAAPYIHAQDAEKKVSDNK